MQIIALKKKIIDPICGSGYFSIYIFGKDWNVGPHFYIHSFFVLLPDKTIFLCI